jgi:hypothetical protein
MPRIVAKQKRKKKTRAVEELRFPEVPMGLAPGLKDESNRLWSELRRTSAAEFQRKDERRIK